MTREVGGSIPSSIIKRSVTEERTCRCSWEIRCRILSLRRPRDESLFTSGWGTNGAFCSPTRRTSRRSARPSSARWPSSSPSSTSATSRSSALSVDPLDRHSGWSKDIEETQGTALNFPLIADPDRKVADLYDMIHPNAERHPDRALGVRHRPGQEGEAHDHLSGEHRPQLRRDPARDRLAAADREATRWRRRSTGSRAKT